MSRNSPSDLHERAQRDSTMPPPAKWPRRERDRPGVVRRSRGKGKGRGPHLTNLFPPKSREQTNDLMNHRASRTMAKGRGWYRSKNGRRWHDIRRKSGVAVCGAEPLRAAGPLKKRDLRDSQRCSDCDAQ